MRRATYLATEVMDGGRASRTSRCVREESRRWRLFFAGCCSRESYDTHWIRRDFAKVPRSRVLEMIGEEFPTVSPASAAEVEGLLGRKVAGFL